MSPVSYATVYRFIFHPRRDDEDRGQGRGAEALLCRGAARRCGLGPLLSYRRQNQAHCPHGKTQRMGLLGRRASRIGFSTNATRRWAMWPRRSRCCSRRPTGRRAPWGCGQWWRRGLLPLQDDDETSLRDSILGTWREMDDRQRLVWNKLLTGEFPCGHLAADDHPGTRRARRPGSHRHLAPAHGCLGAHRRVLPLAPLAGPGGGGCEPPLPAPARLPARRAARDPRRQAPVVRRMETGRDPGPGRQTRRDGLHLVPGRGAAWTDISRACGCSGNPAGRHGHRRGDPPLEGRKPPALQPAAEADRAPVPDPERSSRRFP